MNVKDYNNPSYLFFEACIDVALLPKYQDEYSDLITMSIGDFDSILMQVPVNEDGMFVALACHYHVDTPWEECNEEPWEVDELELSLSQLLYVKESFKNNKVKSDYLDANTNTVVNEKLSQICEDMCFIFSEAIKTGGKVYIRYYY